MNSQYLRYLYSQIVQEGGRVFPQVKLAKLKDLPIKNISLADQQAFILARAFETPVTEKEQKIAKKSVSKVYNVD